MSTEYKLNALLSLPPSFTDELSEGNIYTIEKEGTRIMPVETPMEVCDSNYVYLGKVKVTELVLTNKKTRITFEVVKVFTKEESKIFTDTFIFKETT